MATGSETYLDTCKQLIEAGLNWGSSDNWVNEDFENLSDNIEEKTQVRLSVSTLKRIWGKVQYNSQPTAATLNALAKFAGFENWRAFQQKQRLQEQSTQIVPAPIEAADQAIPVEITPASVIKPVKGFNLRRLLAAAAVLVMLVVLLSLLSVFKPAKNVAKTNATAHFTLRKTSEDLPNSVVFDYDASAFKTDSVYLQQDWDDSRREKLAPNGKQVTSIYYYPGYFNAKLVVDGKIKKEAPVFIQTRGWRGIIQQGVSASYLSNGEIKLPAAMGLTPETLAQKTGSTVFNHVIVHLANVRPFSNTSTADFSLETTVRNSSTVEQSLCRKVFISLICTEGTFFFPLCDKGCIADVNIMAGKTFIPGKTHDLSAFGCDMRQFQHFTCTVHNKQLQVVLNGRPIFNIAQPVSAGDIVGIHYTFEGAGEVKDVKLKSADKVVYEEKF